MSSKVDVVRRLVDAVEARDLEALLDCYDESIEIHEAESLPYGGVYRGHDGALKHSLAWVEAWGRFQTAEESRMDPVILESEGDTVAAVFRHRALDRERGARLDSLEVSVYETRGEKVVRSQMFHADSAAVAQFLAEAQ